jgi:Fe2+ transport system protein FeoA
MKIISLNQVPCGKPFKIIQISTGLEARKKLLALGIHVGDLISKINQTRWNPVLIRNLTTHSSKIAIGQGLARKIMVGDEQL